MANLKIKEANHKEAQLRTEEAIKALQDVENVLLHTLDTNDAIDWEELRDKLVFTIANPNKSLESRILSLNKPLEPNLILHPNVPLESSYKPQFTFFESIIRSKKEKKEKHYQNLFIEAIKGWEHECKLIDNENNNKLKENEISLSQYHFKVNVVKEGVIKEVQIWEKAKADFYLEQLKKNEQINVLKAAYLTGDQAAVLEYCELVLNKSEYPDSFPKNFELDYNPETKILIVEYSLCKYPYKYIFFLDLQQFIISLFELPTLT